MNGLSLRGVRSHTPNVSEDEADHDQLYSSSDDDSGDDTNDFLNWKHLTCVYVYSKNIRSTVTTVYLKEK